MIGSWQFSKYLLSLLDEIQQSRFVDRIYRNDLAGAFWLTHNVQQLVFQSFGRDEKTCQIVTFADLLYRISKFRYRLNKFSL